MSGLAPPARIDTSKAPMAGTRISMIWAQASNGVIGINGQLPWHLPEDLAHFKRLTQGFPVVMGRKTWDSLPPRFRPLPGRTNIVITRQKGWSAPGAQVASGLQEAISLCADSLEAWIIGGAQVYAEAEPYADRLEVTLIEQPFHGDAHAPGLGPNWKEAAREAHVSSTGLSFCFVTYRRTALSA